MTNKHIAFQNIFTFWFILNIAFSPCLSAVVAVNGQTGLRMQNSFNFVSNRVEVFDESQRIASPANQSSTAAINHLAQVMDQFHNRFPVYDDVSSAGNHFHGYAKLPNEFAPVAINGSITSNPNSGATAIRAQLLTDGGIEGGYYFQNGTLSGSQTVPQLNFGTVPNAGITELVNATTLTFWARGEVGGEKIDFFMGGVGRVAETGAVNNPCTLTFPGPCPVPDSSPRIPAYGTPPITLTANWQQYTINLTPPAGYDLSYVLGGFGWFATLTDNPNGAIFYLDDIQYNLNPVGQAQRLNQPRFLRSFTTQPFQSQPPPVNDVDFVLRNTAFIYDNALVLLAFLAHGTEDSLRRAKLIGDALVYASQHDRFYNDGRFRNAYSAGDISLPPGWTPNNQVGAVPTPGFYNETNTQFTEILQDSIDTGNNAWAMIALLALHRRMPNQAYLNAARRIGIFLEDFRNTTGTYQGFQGGLENFPESPNVTRRVYASSEHNEDLTAGYTSLFNATGEVRWQADAQHARQFVEAMWDTGGNCYLTGTTNPQTRNTNPLQLPLDVQAWSVLALPGTLTIHPQVLNCAEQNHRIIADGFNGFDFNTDRDGVWFEGTAQMATAYSLSGQMTLAENLRQELQRAQRTAPFGDGFGIVAASREGLTTGFGFFYFRRLHIGATAWNVFAQKGVNPYYLFVKNPFDFDGDGRSDISVYRPSNGIWYLLRSQTGFTGFQFGIVTDRLAPADFDGDGRTDIAVYRNGTWFIQRSMLGFTSIQFGITEDIPQPADFDGDGRAEVAVFRPSNGTWYIFNLGTNQFTAFQFGISEDKPVVGDYDGDNRADYAVYRPSNGIWYYQQSTAGFGAIQFGLNTDRAVPADYDGDGRTDVAVYRPSDGIWYYQRSTAGFGAIQFGLDTDRPAPADYDGDGRADVAVFRPSNGIWYLQQSTLGFTAVQFGIAEDKPIPNAFVPQ